MSGDTSDTTHGDERCATVARPWESLAPDAAEELPTGPAPGERQVKEEVGWRRIVRNFTPSWFAVNMGTGIVSVLIHQLPYNAAWLRCISIAFFVLNIALFVVFTGITLLRYALYPEIWSAMIRHPSQSLFLGCFPMALATIINMTVLVCADWGHWALYLAWALWWLDLVIAMLCCMLMPFPVMNHHALALPRLTAALLLPFVPAVVASSTGGLLATRLPSDAHAATTLYASCAAWGAGVSLSAAVLAAYFHRLCLHSLPGRDAIVSVFLPVGPLGQGGYGAQMMGRAARALVPRAGVLGGGPVVGEALYALGTVAGLVMWGAGLVWLAFALGGIAVTQRFPFNMGWWGFTFPLGVFALCTGLLAEELESGFLRVLTMVFSISVFLLWLLVAVRTLLMAITGEIFFAPCLQDLRPKTEQADGDRAA